MAETLYDLSKTNTQLIICTHSPLFIPGDSFDKVRIAQESGNPSETKIKCTSYSDLMSLLNSVGEKLIKEEGMVAKLYPSLNPVTNEMFFCKNLILVEGQEDIAYVSSYLILNGLMSEFRKYGCHIVPADGKNRLIKPIAIAKLLQIPTFVMFDQDTDKDQISDPDKRKSEVEKHKKENRAILDLMNNKKNSEWSSSHIIENNLTAWSTNLTKVIEEEFGSDYTKYTNEASDFYGNVGGLKKNPLAIAKALELAWNDGYKSQHLLDLVKRIIKFSKN